LTSRRSSTRTRTSSWCRPGSTRRSRKTPALFSRKFANDELRGHLGFTGTTITDDLEVPVLARSGSAGDRANGAVLAGNDLLLFAQSPGQGFAAAGALERSLSAGTLDRAEFEAAARRTLDLRSRLS
jgi:beta-N-acetylhexosaminidase